MATRHILTVLAGAALLLAGAGASALRHQDRSSPHRHDQRLAREALRRGDVLPLRQMLAAAAARVPGEVVKVELEIEHRRLIYEIKILAEQGTLRTVRLDARTGALIGVEDDD